MRARDGLKWSVANIGLAIFGKLGGKPWKMVPRHEKCLIIGIGQAHRKNDCGGINRYFAYSVLTDSSGLYDSIRILSRSDNKDKYLSGLTASIKSVLVELADHFDRFVIHTPFKIRKDEMDALRSALDDIYKESENNKSLVVLKFNEKIGFIFLSIILHIPILVFVPPISIPKTCCEQFASIFFSLNIFTS